MQNYSHRASSHFQETQGVCVASYGSPERDFPAFYTRRSGSKAVYNFDSAGEAANAISVNGALGLRSGFLIGVPIPAEHALDQALMDGAIAEALAEATRQNIGGKEVTPFILAAVSKITQGKSLQSSEFDVGARNRTSQSSNPPSF